MRFPGRLLQGLVGFIPVTGSLRSSGFSLSKEGNAIQTYGWGLQKQGSSDMLELDE